jgi:hypothetical protein
MEKDVRKNCELTNSKQELMELTYKFMSWKAELPN